MSARSEKSKSSRSEKKHRSSSSRKFKSDRTEDDVTVDVTVDVTNPDDTGEQKDENGLRNGIDEPEDGVGEQNNVNFAAIRELVNDSKAYVEKLNRLADLANLELEEIDNKLAGQNTDGLKQNGMDHEIVGDKEGATQGELEKEINQLQQENKNLQSEIENLKRDLDQRQNSTNTRQDYQDLERQLDRKENDLRRAKSDIDSLERQVDSRDDDIRRLRDNFRKDTQTLQERSDNLQREIDRLKDEQNQRGNPADLPNDYEDIKQRLQDKESELQQTTQELEATKSKITSTTEGGLAAENPNIDSTDTNSHVELAERYTELYENQWSDAFDILEKRIGADENKITSILLTIFLKTKEFCDQESQLQLKEIQKVITQSEKVRKMGVPANVMKYIKDCRKASSAEGIREIYKNYQTWLRSSAFSQARYAKLVKDYTDECFEICWIMAIQDPPIVIASEPTPGDSIDAESYTMYTGTGEFVDFLVWPALLTHTEGTVLSKGVVQATDTPPADIPGGKALDDPRSDQGIGHTSSRDGNLSSRNIRDVVFEDNVSIHRYNNPDSYGYLSKDLRHERFSESHHTRGYDQTRMNTQMLTPSHDPHIPDNFDSNRLVSGPYTPNNWDVTKFLYLRKQHGARRAREMMGSEYDKIEQYFSELS